MPVAAEKMEKCVSSGRRGIENKALKMAVPPRALARSGALAGDKNKVRFRREKKAVRVRLGGSKHRTNLGGCRTTGCCLALVAWHESTSQQSFGLTVAA